MRQCQCSHSFAMGSAFMERLVKKVGYSAPAWWSSFDILSLLPVCQ